MEPVNVKDDKMMVDEGIRVPMLQPRDESVWSKTPNEKQLLYRLRDSNFGHFAYVPNKMIPVRDKLIIFLKKNKTFRKSTYSLECWQHEIPYLLSRYREDGKSVVCKYNWNGKTYKATEVPYWR